MAVNMPRFQRAQDFLTTRVGLRPAVKRIGMLLHARLDTAAEASAARSNARGLRSLVQQVAANTQRAFRSHLAEFSEDSQRIAMEFFFAQSNRLSAAAQLALFREGQDSGGVAYAAARQRTVPRELQQALVEEGFHHVDAMQALASNPSTHPQTLLPLTSHSNRGVRLAVAAHIGPRMRVEEPELETDKQLVFNALVDRYEDGYAPFIIPVCKDLEQLKWMFDRSTMTPANAHLFTDNPYASNDILLSVLGSNRIGLLPGGQDVKDRARALVDNRLGDHEPTP